MWTEGDSHKEQYGKGDWNVLVLCDLCVNEQKVFTLGEWFEIRMMRKLEEVS